MTMFRKVFTDRMTGESTPTEVAPPSDIEEAIPVGDRQQASMFHGADQTHRPAEHVPVAPSVQDTPQSIVREAMAPPSPPPMESAHRPVSQERGVDRTRTRVIGFASKGLEDPFEAAGQPNDSNLFPAGWLVVVEGPGAGHHFAVTSGVTTIGRGADQGISLNFGDTSISRSGHASVAYDALDNACYLGHGGKSNIIRLNDKPVLSTELLSDGDTIRIGETLLRFAAFCGPSFSWGAHQDV